MLVIQESYVKNIISLAKEAHPIETCGVIVAKKNDPDKTRFLPMRNIANSETFFQFDPQEQFKLVRDMNKRDEYLWVIFHSHTSSEAYPSREDIQFSAEPDSHYVIVSTDDVVNESLRSFRVSSQKKVIEETIRIKPEH